MSGIDPAAILKVISDLQTRNALLEQKVAEQAAQLAQLQPQKEGPA